MAARAHGAGARAHSSAEERAMCVCDAGCGASGPTARGYDVCGPREYDVCAAGAASTTRREYELEARGRTAVAVATAAASSGSHAAPREPNDQGPGPADGEGDADGDAAPRPVVSEAKGPTAPSSAAAPPGSSSAPSWRVGVDARPESQPLALALPLAATDARACCRRVSTASRRGRRPPRDSAPHARSLPRGSAFAAAPCRCCCCCTSCRCCCCTS